MNTTTITKRVASLEDQPPNDCIKTPEQIAVEVNELCKEEYTAGELGLRKAWEAGVRLNLIRETLRATKQGAWGEFQQKHFPDISAMTIWRCREIAKFFNSVLEFDGMTLSDAYHRMKLAKFNEKADRPGVKKAPDSHIVKLFKKIAKLSRKFDIPATLSSDDASTVKKGAEKLAVVLAEREKATAKVVDLRAEVSGEQEEE